jgi:hypothetical protein
MRDSSLKFLEKINTSISWVTVKLFQVYFFDHWFFFFFVQLLQRRREERLQLFSKSKQDKFQNHRNLKFQEDGYLLEIEFLYVEGFFLLIEIKTI